MSIDLKKMQTKIDFFFRFVFLNFLQLNMLNREKSIDHLPGILLV